VLTVLVVSARAAVKAAKSRAEDAIPLARRVLTAAAAPIRPDHYVQRGIETSLAEILSREGVLLLSGTPRVGKSSAARWVAADFVQHGYDLQEFSEVEDAERFLLGDGRLIPEPGCLEHLAANVDRLPSNPTLDDIRRLAREDAAQLGLALVAEGYEGLAVSLALTTTAQEPVGLLELAFSRGAGGATLPGKSSSLGVTIGGPRQPPSTAPTYDEAPKLSLSDREGLDALERRRLIAIDAEPSVGFVHDFYRALPAVLERRARTRSAHYRDIGKGLFTPPIVSTPLTPSFGT